MNMLQILPKLSDEEITFCCEAIWQMRGWPHHLNPKQIRQELPLTDINTVLLACKHRNKKRRCSWQDDVSELTNKLETFTRAL